MAKAFGGNFAVMDLYSAQFVFGRGRTFDRVDVTLKEGVRIDDAIALLEKSIALGIKDVRLTETLAGAYLEKGRVVEIFGPRLGKDDLSPPCYCRGPEKGGIAAFIDAEHALDVQYAKRLGVKIDELRWIRILYAYPKDHYFQEGLLETMAKEKKVCPYLDIPIQHVDDGILRRMGRKSTGREIRTPHREDQIFYPGNQSSIFPDGWVPGEGEGRRANLVGRPARRGIRQGLRGVEGRGEDQGRDLP
jgi:hypothetical protein